MTQYIPILIMDEDDTSNHGALTLQEFLDVIEEHRSNAGVDPEDVFVKITTEEYDDEELGLTEMGTIEFLVKK